jgi:hypothetical protein
MHFVSRNPSAAGRAEPRRPCPPHHPASKLSVSVRADGHTMRKVALIVMSIGVCLASFFATLWLTDRGRSTDPSKSGSAARELASRTISNRFDLIEAAVGERLHKSAALTGHVDSFTRANDREVKIAGWLADRGGDETGITVLVFVAGRNVAMTQTRGERPDVTKALDLVHGAERNVAFEATFDCRSGDQPMIVALGLNRQYAQLPSPQCP